MSITAVVATRDRQHLLGGMVDNFRSHGVESIVIVDQSPQAFTGFGAGNGSDVTYRHRPDLNGASAARNEGAALARSRWLWFADDDCWLCERLRAPECCHDRALLFFPWRRKDQRLLPWIRFLQRMVPRNRFYWWLMPLTGTPFFMVRREHFLRVRFDETLGPGTRLPTSEDLDLVYRFIRRCRSFCLCRDGVVEHALGDPDAAARRAHETSRRRVLEKNGAWSLMLADKLYHAAKNCRPF